ncbi:MAG TPA: hypothetical protein VHY48_00930 [Acidobacteriaceae bacterium]|jgi:hypothetical protein|nr:hypothetical protein [Acidobacteriaceae bacterium]
MSLAHDLLLQAHLLASLDPRRPKQANLRRAVSAAYYALFHLLLEESSQALAGVRVTGLAPRVSRAFTHVDMRKACLAFIAQPPQAPLDGLLVHPISHNLRLIAERFIKLQELRHSADYDTTTSFSKVETLALIGSTQIAFAAWRSIRTTDEASIFLAALAFGARWSK